MNLNCPYHILNTGEFGNGNHSDTENIGMLYVEVKLPTTKGSMKNIGE